MDVQTFDVIEKQCSFPWLVLCSVVWLEKLKTKRILNLFFSARKDTKKRHTCNCVVLDVMMFGLCFAFSVCLCVGLGLDLLDG